VTHVQVVQCDLMIGVHIMSREMDVITVKVILFLFLFRLRTTHILAHFRVMMLWVAATA